MQRWTVVFLVLLRLSIGWHFLFEGLNKIHSHMVGPTINGTVEKKPFSSAGYFKEAPGPLGHVFRAYTGEPDEEAMARLVPAVRTGDPATDKPHARMPAGLRRDWEALVKRYVDHCNIDADAAATLLDQHAGPAVAWLEYEPDPILKDVLARFGKIDSVDVKLLDEKERAAYDGFLANSSDQTRTFISGDVTRRMTPPERIADYRAKLADLRDRSGRKLWLFSRDVEGARLREAKAEVAKLRGGLLTELDATQTRPFVQGLNSLALREDGDLVNKVRTSLKGEEFMLVRAAITLPKTPTDPKAFAAMLDEVVAALRQQADKKATTPEQAKTYRADADELASASMVLSSKSTVLWQEKSDWYLSLALAAIGACVLVGFFTRLACWLAALFLLMTYLAVPSFPWLPAAGPQEGNYVFVNKNVVEFFALCVLGTLPTGRWFGADGLLLALWRFLTGSNENK